MNKKDIIDGVSVEADATKGDSKIFLDAFIRVVGEALKNGDSVHLQGFGTFEVRERKPHATKHPTTGEHIIIPGRKNCKFTQGAKLKRMINGDEEDGF